MRWPPIAADECRDHGPCLDVLSRLDAAALDRARERSFDACVAQVQRSHAEASARLRLLGAGGRELRLPRAHLDARRNALGGELLEALDLALRFRSPGLGALERSPSGRDGELVALRFDLREERAFLHGVALLEVKALEHSGDARRDLHVFERLDRSDARDRVVDAPELDRLHIDRKDDLLRAPRLLLLGRRRARTGGRRP